MISEQTAIKISDCYYEIRQANKLIDSLKEILYTKGNLNATDIQLGVHSGDVLKRVFDVPIDLTLCLINGYILAKNQSLKELRSQVKIEMDESQIV